MKYDFIIVGSGLTGATIARLLTDSGFSVLVLEKREHLGGNVHDHVHESGIRVHTYGPHYFRTNDLRIWNFVNKYSEFYSYVPCLKSYVDGEYENWPIAASYISKNIGIHWKPEFSGKASNFEEAALSLMPKEIYYKFVKGYNIKQWGVDPTQLSSSLIKRFDVRLDDDPRLMPKHKYQGIPKFGYFKFMEEMLKGIIVILNCDFLGNRSLFQAKQKIIYTGPINLLFDNIYGSLKYRGQNRIHTYIPNVHFIQPCGQVNNPLLENGEHIRTLEWKHMMEKPYLEYIKGTVVTREITIIPDDPDQFEYPFPDKDNKDIYLKYQKLATRESGLLVCGRLGEYRYYDMDQAIARAFMITKQLTN